MVTYLLSHGASGSKTALECAVDSKNTAAICNIIRNIAWDQNHVPIDPDDDGESSCDSEAEKKSSTTHQILKLIVTQSTQAIFIEAVKAVTNALGKSTELLTG